MRKQFIPELNQELSGSKLDIWLGTDENGKKVNLTKHERSVKMASWRRLASRGIRLGEFSQERLPKPCNCGDKSSSQTPPVTG